MPPEIIATPFSLETSFYHFYCTLFLKETPTSHSRPHRFVAGVLRFAQRIRLTPSEVSLMSPFFTLYSVHGVTVNDILSYEKEVRLYEETKAEGAFILNMTQAFSNDTGLPQRASKRVLWILIREWEIIWADKAKELRAKGISKALGEYLTGMEYVLGGNEWWSWRTKRYQRKQLADWAG